MLNLKVHLANNPLLADMVSFTRRLKANKTDNAALPQRPDAGELKCSSRMPLFKFMPRPRARLRLQQTEWE